MALLRWQPSARGCWWLSGPDEGGSANVGCATSPKRSAIANADVAMRTTRRRREGRDMPGDQYPGAKQGKPSTRGSAERNRARRGPEGGPAGTVRVALPRDRGLLAHGLLGPVAHPAREGRLQRRPLIRAERDGVVGSLERL